MSAWKRSDWNDIIQRVNALGANPPEEHCNPVEGPEEVEEGHIWSRIDIEWVQDTLQEICNQNTFSRALVLWKQEVIDEIESAIAKGWCNCEPIEDWPPCSNAGPPSETACGIAVFSGCAEPTPMPLGNAVNQLGHEARAKTRQWANTKTTYCTLQKDIIDLEKKSAVLQAQLAALNTAYEEACKYGKDHCEYAQSRIDGAQFWVDMNQNEINQKNQDLTTKEAEADQYAAEAEAKAAECMALAPSFPAYGQTFSWVECIEPEPWADSSCINLEVGPWSQPEIWRCEVFWRIYGQPIGATDPDLWNYCMGGGYTPGGQPYITGMSYAGPPGFACTPDSAGFGGYEDCSKVPPELCPDHSSRYKFVKFFPH